MSGYCKQNNYSYKYCYTTIISSSRIGFIIVIIRDNNAYRLL